MIDWGIVGLVLTTITILGTFLAREFKHVSRVSVLETEVKVLTNSDKVNCESIAGLKKQYAEIEVLRNELKNQKDDLSDIKIMTTNIYNILIKK